MDKAVAIAATSAAVVCVGALVARRLWCKAAAETHEAAPPCTQFAPTSSSVDVLYHLGVSSDEADAVAQFKDTKFVVMAGTQSRAR